MCSCDPRLPKQYKEASDSIPADAAAEDSRISPRGSEGVQRSINGLLVLESRYLRGELQHRVDGKPHPVARYIQCSCKQYKLHVSPSTNKPYQVSGLEALQEVLLLKAFYVHPEYGPTLLAVDGTLLSKNTIHLALCKPYGTFSLRKPNEAVHDINGTVSGPISQMALTTAPQERKFTRGPK